MEVMGRHISAGGQMSTRAWWSQMVLTPHLMSPLIYGCVHPTPACFWHKHHTHSLYSQATVMPIYPDHLAYTQV